MVLPPSDPREGTESLIMVNAGLNSIPLDDYFLTSSYFWIIVSLVTLLIGLYGLVGNGTVIWLLGFCIKRNAFSVYILNLACSNFSFLFCRITLCILSLLNTNKTALDKLLDTVGGWFYLVSAFLLVTISTECCVSVLCPIWYRCHRPAHLSSILCALIWGLKSSAGTLNVLCGSLMTLSCHRMYLIYDVMSPLAFVALCVSGLTLLIQVCCCSKRQRPTRLSVTIVLSVLAFLLLGLPLRVGYIAQMWSSVHHSYHIQLHIYSLLTVLSGTVNPIIYFFVGKYRKPLGQNPLQEVLQNALSDAAEEVERRRADNTVPRLATTAV